MTAIATTKIKAEIMLLPLRTRRTHPMCLMGVGGGSVVMLSDPLATL